MESHANITVKFIAKCTVLLKGGRKQNFVYIFGQSKLFRAHWNGVTPVIGI